MSASRFDPKPGEPYARCSEDGCGFVADTKEQMSEHSSSTMKPTGQTSGVTASGHSYRVENPSREDAIWREVMREADDALESAVQEFVDSVYRLHSREGVSLDELTVAVKSVAPSSEWSEAWAEYIADEDEDDDDEDETDTGDGLGPQLHQDTALFGTEAVSA